MIKHENLRGTIHEKGEERLVGQKRTRKSTVVIKTYDQRPSYYSLEVMGDENNDKLKALERLNPVVVDFGLFGNQWTNKEGVTKYFNNLNLFDIRIDTQSEVTQKAKEVTAALDLVAGTESAYTTKQNKQEDGLPF